MSYSIKVYNKKKFDYVKKVYRIKSKKGNDVLNTTLI